MRPDDPILSLLAAAPQFAELDRQAIERIASSCRPRVFRAGQLVFTEHDPCRSLYILESGRVKFFRMNAEGREQVLKIVSSIGPRLHRSPLIQWSGRPSA